MRGSWSRGEKVGTLLRPPKEEAAWAEDGFGQQQLMFIGDQYPYARSWGPCPLCFSLQLHSSLSNSEDRPCSRGRDMECRSGSPGPPPWTPGGGLRGLKSQFSARVGDSHSLTHALVFLPPWSLPGPLCCAHPLTRTMLPPHCPWLPHSIPCHRDPVWS